MDVISFLEKILPILMPDFQYEFVDPGEIYGKYAETTPSRKLIQIRCDVYERAVAGSARDRFTIAHEIGHLLLHNEEDISFSRMEHKTAIPKYLDPEWQANTFAAEFLMNANLIKGMTAEQVSCLCGTSFQTAEIQLKYV